MIQLTHRKENDALVIALNGAIDSGNAGQAEQEIQAILAENPAQSLQIDCADLQYCSSAGLRIILALKHQIDDTHLINVSSALYEILEMTGFTEIMDVKKAYRVLSVEGCEVIGRGARGTVYRIDRDTIVKVYHSDDALPEIHRERELARTAFVAGVPTAIPYDVVRIEGAGYGSVFELLNADSFDTLLIRGEKTVDEVVNTSVGLLKIIHSKTVRPDAVPDIKSVALGWVDFVAKYLPGDQGKKLRSLVEAVPDDLHLVHGDFHLKNIMQQNGESLLIDMDTLSHGHPIFELACMYNPYVGYCEADGADFNEFLGIPFETSAEVWRKSLRLYLEGKDEAFVRAVEEKAMLMGSVRILHHNIRKLGMEKGRAAIEHTQRQIADLLQRLDTLVF